jgi:hypothetical protein
MADREFHYAGCPATNMAITRADCTCASKDAEQSNAVLVAALRPFAELTPPESAPDNALVVLAAMSGGMLDTRQTVTVGAIRRASAALAGHTAGVVCVPADVLTDLLDWDGGHGSKGFHADKSFEARVKLRALVEGGKQSHG